MNRQTTENKQITELQDAVNGLKAVCMHFLSASYSPAQAQVMMDDFMIRNTAEAVRKKEAEQKAKREREAIANAKTDFKEKLGMEYWVLCYMTEKQRREHIKAIWMDISSDYEIPEHVQQPSYKHTMPEYDDLLKRKVELDRIIESCNLTQAEDTQEFCKRAIADFKDSLETQARSRVRSIKRRTDISEMDKQQLIAQEKSDCERKIRSHEANMSRQILTAKANMAQVENAKGEIEKLKRLIAKAI